MKLFSFIFCEGHGSERKETSSCWSQDCSKHDSTNRCFFFVTTLHPIRLIFTEHLQRARPLSQCWAQTVKKMAVSPALLELIFQRGGRKPGGNRVISARDQGHDSMNGDVSEGSSRGEAALAWMGREVTSAEGHTCQGWSNQKCRSGERMRRAEGQRGTEAGCQRSMWLQYKWCAEEGWGRGWRRKSGWILKHLSSPVRLWHFILWVMRKHWRVWSREWISQVAEIILLTAHTRLLP